MLRALVVVNVAALVSLTYANVGIAEEPAADAAAFLSKYCKNCHHGEVKKGNKEYDVLSMDSLLNSPPKESTLEKFPEAEAYVVPSKPDKSLVWLRANKDMPPKTAKAKPTEDDLKVLRKWIEDGAVAKPNQ